MQSSIWLASFLFVLAIDVDSMLLKVDLFMGQSSMVAENLKRIEKQDEVSKPMLETALKSAATTAITGK